jgi:uncharacterized coiled-coil DUF342 family protein
VAGCQVTTPIDTPDTRTVCQHTGTVLTGEGLRAANDSLATTVARLTQERDDAIAERDNMIDLTIQVGRLGDYLKHAIADRDEYRERADEWRDRFEDAQCRMDEMADEIRELRGAK